MSNPDSCSALGYLLHALPGSKGSQSEVGALRWQISVSCPCRRQQTHRRREERNSRLETGGDCRKVPPLPTSPRLHRCPSEVSHLRQRTLGQSQDRVQREEPVR